MPDPFTVLITIGLTLMLAGVILIFVSILFF